MNFEVKSISSEQAKSLSEYIFPPVLALTGFNDFAFYIAIHDKELLGMTVIELDPDTPEILSIAVNPNYCNQGIATEMLQDVIAKVLALYNSESTGEDKQFYVSFDSELKVSPVLARLFEKLDFEQWDTGFFYDISKKQLLNNESLNIPSVKDKVAKKIKNKQIISLKNANKQEVKTFLLKLSEEDDLIDYIDIDALDEDVSFFSLADGKITSCILFTKLQDNILRNVLVYQLPQKDLGKAELLFLLSASSTAIVEKFTDDIELSFLITNESSDNLLHKLFDSTSKSSRPLIYGLDFEDAEIMLSNLRFTSDMVFHQISLDNMVCNSCKYCQDSIYECEKFYQKPERVVDGEECNYYESK